MPNDLFDLTGKVAIVTGGNGGIGLGIGEGLVAAGSHVVVAARDETKTEQALARIGALGVRAVGVRTETSGP